MSSSDSDSLGRVLFVRVGFAGIIAFEVMDDLAPTQSVFRTEKHVFLGPAIETKIDDAGQSLSTSNLPLLILSSSLGLSVEPDPSRFVAVGWTRMLTVYGPREPKNLD